MTVVNEIEECCHVAVGLFDGAYGWVAELIGIVSIVVLVNFFFRWFLKKLHKRLESQGKVWKDSFVRALYKPLSWYVWFFAIIQSIDLLHFRLFGNGLIREMHLLLYLVAIVAVAWFLLRWKKNVVEHMQREIALNRLHMQRTKIDVMDKLATISIFFFTLLFFLDATGQNVNTLIAFGGVGGLALAFASQEIIASFFGGLMIYLTHPFLVGDWVHLPERGIEGHVEEIGWYMTRIRTFEKRPIYIPNSTFSKIVVVTPSRMTHRRIRETISLRYEDLPKLPTILSEIREMLFAMPEIDSTQTMLINLDKMASYSLDVLLSCYTLTIDAVGYHRVKEKVLLGVLGIVNQNGASIAVPTALYMKE